MNNKITQEHYLVVYQEKQDLVDFFLKKTEDSLKFKHHIKDKALTIVPKYNPDIQHKYYSVLYSGDYLRFIQSIMGAQFVGVCYLDGDYPANVFNYSLSRCRGGIWEVDRI